MIVDNNHVRSSRALPVLKVMASSEVELVLLSPSPIWIETHWMEKQFLCPGDLCPVCGGGGGRQHGYVVAATKSTKSTRVILLELTPNTWERLSGLSKMDGLMLESGSVMRASRRRRNSPLVLDPLGFTAAYDPADCTPARTIDAMATLYGLPVLLNAETPLQWSNRVRALSIAMLDRVVTSAD